MPALGRQGGATENEGQGQGHERSKVRAHENLRFGQYSSMRPCPFGLGLLLSSLLLLTGWSPCARAEDTAVTALALENGLRVKLRPVKGAERVGVLLLFDLGHEHDPEGASGLTHLVEHLFVSSAAGEIPARTAEELMAQYPMAWNAQTGSRSTILYLETPKARAGELLGEFAARMGALRITAEELAREKERVLTEVEGMFGGAPGLAAFNHARERAMPSPGNGRRGGAPDQVSALSLDTVKTFHARYYQPRNAWLVVVGDFDISEMEKAVRARFSPLGAGEAAPARRPAGAAAGPEVKAVPAMRMPRLPDRQLVVGWRAPEVDDPLFPAFLIAVARLLASSNNQLLGARMFPPPVYYAALDEPDALYMSRLLDAETDAEQAAQRLQEKVNEALAQPIRDADAKVAPLGPLLGTTQWPESVLRQNLYGVALGIGRQAQMGLDPPALRLRLEAVTAEDLKALGEQWLSPARRGAAVAGAGP